VIPEKSASAIWEKGRWEIARIDEIEKETKHDVIAFLTNLAEHVGEDARFIHQGMTSSDVLDTCLSVQLSQAADILIDDTQKLLTALKTRALEHKETICIGRSHAIHAEPTTFGLKLASHYAEFERDLGRLKAARNEIASIAISGAVGTFANIDPFVEKYVAEKMGLTPEPVSTQIIPRDRHAMFFATLGIVSSSLERLAIEIRHLQRTELREVEEFFAPGQKGSSAMPHKRNPVLTENITGLARIVRSAVAPAMENIALWHERDISHSSVERVIGPDTTVALDFSLARMTGVIEKLIVYPKMMKKNLEALGGLVFSQRVLLALTQLGMSREDAYETVQKNAMKVWKDGTSFLAQLQKDKQIKKLIAAKDLAALFDLKYHTKNINHIFERVFNTKE
jgi:adenylosuccinate lyase